MSQTSFCKLSWLTWWHPSPWVFVDVHFQDDKLQSAAITTSLDSRLTSILVSSVCDLCRSIPSFSAVSRARGAGEDQTNGLHIYSSQTPPYPSLCFLVVKDDFGPSFFEKDEGRSHRESELKKFTRQAHNVFSKSNGIKLNASVRYCATT